MENIYHTIRGRTTSPRTLESISKDPLSAAKPYMCNPPLLTCKQASKLEIHNPELTDEYIYDLLLLSFVISLITIKLTFLSFSMFS